MPGPPSRHEESALARAKNTARSEARRRTRELTRAELAAQEDIDATDGTTATTATTASTEDARPPRRRGQLFQWPDVRADVRALPSMFRTKRLLWLPFVLVAVGFVLAMTFTMLPTQIQQWALLYFQYFFAPQALFTYFIGGFLAPRASYLIGLILGAITGVLWSIVLLANTVGGTDLVTSTGDLASTIGTVLLASIILGMFAAGFAGWYRDFLRGMQTRSRERQIQRENEAKQRRAAERQEARRAAKQRPAS
jgi:hypothetical protein